MTRARRLRRAGRGGGAPIVPCSGVTFWPGRARNSPLMMIWSSAVMPLLITRRLSSVTGPSSTGFGTTVPSGATVNSILTDWSVTTAASGTSRVGRSCDIGTRTRPNWLGRDEEIGIGEGGAHADRAR